MLYCSGLGFWAMSYNTYNKEGHKCIGIYLSPYTHQVLQAMYCSTSSRLDRARAEGCPSPLASDTKLRNPVQKHRTCLRSLSFWGFGLRTLNSVKALPPALFHYPCLSLPSQIGTSPTTPKPRLASSPPQPPPSKAQKSQKSPNPRTPTL